ncbi:alpha/beta hydrolase [Tuwongella immobilis]|uniref:AB hydrolase-1 domain-containing protein n=1 Tax=Tuwongella immobilis TaxID=692036 RepID=A0A6C2YGV7_9BACT|nr:alpha/beta fold hydrolase [Tuwongella immobilis]VIP00594.1 Putative lysophospholipase OS=Singulisphaera acidiphila (strain ATCC BAA-1392 / DSM 18658 / VKM B-2454 / MOB10) GN=Sinac_6214 PE=4 SV=1: Abhydrolase_6 [Tuwongella immobilis]VTR96606.1 Putative lysophospholipase OS=Singulisphaera acidiphila (strain ATCC BAA-1392 / DSM 18658 / VKM B-2454 / MOB10) GN=Sinac_6214 PE=4 SV=1: Abhydrolase_6 [Tuwongella immobilis]
MNGVFAGILLMALPLLVVVAALTALHYYLRRRYLDYLVRIFQEKPLFVIPRGQPQPDAEDITLHSPDGITLRACYLHTTQPRKGVILFGLEFGSNRWSCQSYCDYLLAAGYDVFACEVRNQGDSTKQPSYATLQWATNLDLLDTQTALAYLKSRPDADSRGVGLFGISKGGTLGLLAAANDPFIRCAVTDGAFATYSTMVPYMRQWIAIYNNRYWVQKLLPAWFYGQLALVGIRRVERAQKLRYLHLESAVQQFGRPWLMIHGEQDSYIKPQMAREVFDYAAPPCEFWLVEKAKHNQALHVAGDAYRSRVLAFFDQYLAQAVPVVPFRRRGTPHPEVTGSLAEH